MTKDDLQTFDADELVDYNKIREVFNELVRQVRSLNERVNELETEVAWLKR